MRSPGRRPSLGRNSTKEADDGRSARARRDRRGEAGAVRVPCRGRDRRDPQHGARRDGRQARPLPALAGAGPLTSTELAERTGTAERYVREWLNAQAAGGYVEYDPVSG